MNFKDNIIKIIKEEIDRWFDDEPSLLDKYHEKRFGTGRQEPQQDYKQNDASNGQLVGFLDKAWTQKLNNPIPVYKNPKNLNNFDINVRGVLLQNGDLFLGGTAEAMHWNILQLLLKLGYLDRNVSIVSYSTTMPEEFITVVRLGKSNNFSDGGSYNEFPIYYETMFDDANKLHSYKFKSLNR